MTYKDPYADPSQSRGLNCYACGKRFNSVSQKAEILSQGKMRDVHPRCKTKLEKIAKEL